VKCRLPSTILVLWLELATRTKPRTAIHSFIHLLPATTTVSSSCFLLCVPFTGCVLASLFRLVVAYNWPFRRIFPTRHPTALIHGNELIETKSKIALPQQQKRKNHPGNWIGSTTVQG